MTRNKQLPRITKREEVARSKLFSIERIDLTFSNGVQREYERMQGAGRGAVMIVPLLDKATNLLDRQDCAGSHSYELGCPNVLIDKGELAEQAANRELKEEIGYGSDNLIHVQQVTMAPAFFSATMDIFIAQNLYQEWLTGDEPEPLDVVPWKLSEFKSLLAQPDFNEARSIAALMLVKEQLGGAQ